MKLHNLTTQSFRSLPDATWSFADGAGTQAHPITIVTGKAGCGLTSFMDAIAVVAARLGRFGAAPDASDVLRGDASVGRVRTRWELNEEEMRAGGTNEPLQDADIVFRRGALGMTEADPALLGALSKYDHKPTTSKVVYFPALRITNAGFTPMSDFESDQRSTHLSSDPQKYAGLPRAITALAFKRAAGGDDALARLEQLFAKLSPVARFAGLSGTGQPEFKSARQPIIPFRRLSFAERNAFVFAASFALMGLERSVILVDAPELGLAPGEAARWLDVLREVAPAAQWIVATRDPALLSERHVVEVARG